MKIKLLFILAVVGTTMSSNAFIADSLEVHEKLALFQDAAKAKQYREAASYLHWLLKNKPKQHVSIYIIGADVLDELAKVDKATDHKRTLVD
jgi:transcriptional regulator NrdR family protein